MEVSDLASLRPELERFVSRFDDCVKGEGFSWIDLGTTCPGHRVTANRDGNQRSLWLGCDSLLDLIRHEKDQSEERECDDNSNCHLAFEVHRCILACSFREWIPSSAAVSGRATPQEACSSEASLLLTSR